MSRSLLSRVRDQQPISLSRPGRRRTRRRAPRFFLPRSRTWKLGRDSLPLARSLARSAWPLRVRDNARLLSSSRVLHLRPSSVREFREGGERERKRDRKRERERERGEEEVILIVSFGHRTLLGGPASSARTCAPPSPLLSPSVGRSHSFVPSFVGSAHRSRSVCALRIVCVLPCACASLSPLPPLPVAAAHAPPA